MARAPPQATTRTAAIAKAAAAGRMDAGPRRVRGVVERIAGEPTIDPKRTSAAAERRT
jgi:hypothetical protein